MSFKKIFLELEIRNQITYVIRLLLFCFCLLMYACFGSYIYEILNQSYRQQKRYFSAMEGSIVERIIFFQSLQLLYYEDLTKNSVHRILEHLNNSYFISKEVYNETFVNNHLAEINFSENQKDNCLSSDTQINCLYYFSVDENNFFDNTTDDIKQLKQTLVKMLPILSINYNTTMNFMGVKRKIFNLFTIYFDKYKVLVTSSNKDLSRFQDLRIKQDMLTEAIKNYLSNLSDENFSFLNYIYSSLSMGNEFNTSDFDSILYHQPFINYTSNAIYNIDSSSEKHSLACLFLLEPNFIDQFYSRIMNAFIEYTAIPTYYDQEKKTSHLKAKSPCYFLLSLQDERYSVLNDSDVDLSIRDCFILPETKEQADSFPFNYTIQTNESLFMLYNFYQQKYFFLDGNKRSKYKKYLAMKHSFPNFNALTAFLPNFYSFEKYTIFSFYAHAKFKMFTKEIQHLMHNLLLLSLLCMMVNMIFAGGMILWSTKKLSKEVTEPLDKLRSSVESMTFNDASIFTYKDDDIINEMFGTCRDLLKGALIVQKKADEHLQTNTQAHNIFVNQELISKIPVEENITRYSKFKIGSFDEKESRMRKDFLRKKTRSCEEYIAELGNDKSLEQLMRIAKEIFDSNTYNLNMVKDKKGNWVKNKKNVLFDWYMSYKEKGGCSAIKRSSTGVSKKDSTKLVV